MVTAGLAVFAAALSVPAQEGPSRQALQAAFVFKFASFVDWPEGVFEDDTAPFTIGVLGDSGVYNELEIQTEDKTVGPRPIVLRFASEAAELVGCQIVFIAEDIDLGEMTETFEENNILTVSMARNFTKDGGVIRLFEDNRRMNIEVNVKAAERADLKISSKLMSLAKIYEEG